MDIERVDLPGIGTKDVLTTAKGRRVGVVAHHTGRRDLVVFRRDDPDSSADSLVLTAAEANALAELLGEARVVDRLAELHRQVEGLVGVQVPIAAGSVYQGRPLGATKARTRTGASIVAVVRGSAVIASPGPDFVFEAGDVVVAVGTRAGTAAVIDLLGGG